MSAHVLCQVSFILQHQMLDLFVASSLNNCTSVQPVLLTEWLCSNINSKALCICGQSMLVCIDKHWVWTNVVCMQMNSNRHILLKKSIFHFVLQFCCPGEKTLKVCEKRTQTPWSVYLQQSKRILLRCVMLLPNRAAMLWAGPWQFVTWPPLWRCAQRKLGMKFLHDPGLPPCPLPSKQEHACARAALMSRHSAARHRESLIM